MQRNTYRINHIQTLVGFERKVQKMQFCNLEVKVQKVKFMQ